MNTPHRISKLPTSGQKILCLRVQIEGAVQGVGFRPFVYRLATRLGLSGWVGNSSQGVMIELEGNVEMLDEFLTCIKVEAPTNSLIKNMQYSIVDAVGYDAFTIKESDQSGEKIALIMPDIAVCPDCLEDIFNPDNRRYHYPFTNCTNCGPRYSIIESLPYDRANTTMKIFTMCDECRAEYEDPSNRRFHAQPNACPDCGPHLELWDKGGKVLTSNHKALLEACNVISKGGIAAIKGLGGFHLIVDAANDQAVRRLRRLKSREEKPLALMYPDIETVKSDCELTELEKQLLCSPESPIVLLKRKNMSKADSVNICSAVSPDNPYLGIMLAYTPLHHLLMAELKSPVVATSGNLADEPICIDENETLARLCNIADVFLVHNRPIARHVDDSIVRVMMGREMILRRARGYAPLPIVSKKEMPSVLAVGGHLKNSVAISKGKQFFISQHIGDLDCKQTYDTFVKVIESLSDIYDFKPELISCDGHPDYISTKYAVDSGIARVEVQHHFAHILSCMADNELDGSVLGVSWDGTGYGPDGTIWGGEFLKVDELAFSRVAHLRNFCLPGGEKAIKEPWRAALGLLYEIYGSKLFSTNKIERIFTLDEDDKNILQKMLEQKINAPLTSSAGRLFDAVASIIGLCQTMSFEGQAAMKMEFAAENYATDEFYNFSIDRKKIPYIVDWQPMISEILNDQKELKPVELMAAKSHNTLAEMIIEVARYIGEKRIVLTGGCFQNKYLTERAITRLTESGFQPYWHRLAPPNDGGICLGQLVACSNNKAEE